MSMKPGSKWNVYAVVDSKPIAIQNKAPLTYWNASLMAARLKKDTKRVSRVLITQCLKPSAVRQNGTAPLAEQQRKAL